MSIPENGRVVIIDDEIEEGLPLMQALIRNRIPVFYFTGNLDDLPTKPIEETRLVFLDIVLGANIKPKNVISTVVNVLKKIIGVKNGPYLIVAWTKHEEYIEEIKKALKDRPPICFLNLEKNECKNSAGAYDINKIQNKIKEALRKSKSFQILTIWENHVHKSAGEIVKDFSSFFKVDDEWDKKMLSIFFCLAEAYAGKQLKSNQKDEIIKNALLTFNGTFLDSLESKIRSYREYENFEKTEASDNLNLNNEILAQINSMLFIVKGEDTAKPGNVYKISKNSRIEFQKTIIFDCIDPREAQKLFAEKESLELSELLESDNRIKKQYKSKYKDFEEDLRRRIRDDALYVLFEVSPYCDYTQNKWKIHRLLAGLIWPVEFQKLIKKADYIYATPLFHMENIKCKYGKIIFDLRYLKSFSFEELSKRKILFRMRHPLLVDVQTYLAKHINRPGIISV